ncbi:alpha-N-arabinofuranosidase [Plantibacter sp. MCCC 1A11337]|uniref:arabinosylfuranosidase ArfA n=1 Tax=Plantibacter sp. MCCC 1A11337 TaxID=2736644 RepID=UPI0015818A67|nr:alpha-N-arabinofuranosidase [Plantibacter sp. MCCC 1A11337]NUJ89095.1 alpha-N-arabinofuranosidase [Plantibacter sp. MCCC 1A11337]
MTSRQRALLTTSQTHPIGEIDRRLFGSFIEHLGRCVYDGVLEPGHPLADERGFRSDVLDLVQELGVTTVRYPGGNFVSGFCWEDAVGPKEQRPRRLDLAWHSTETNQFGLDEFIDWAAEADVEPMYAVNLGTRGVEEALNVLEYSNHRSGTELADARIANGHRKPHAIRMWCLGDEMDGPWQLGHRNATDNGKVAARTARAMRQFDESLELVVCGSSHARMPTFGAWEHAVLSETFDDVDFISAHAYFEETDGDAATFLASAVEMDRFIEAVAAQADAVAGARKSTKQIMISFDEWKVWYSARFNQEEKITAPDQWPEAPRLLEDRYSVLDAVVLGGLLISLLNHADRVKAASLAQLVNVIAPIMTEPGGPAWRQTIFYPFAATSALATGRTLRTTFETPTYDTEKYGTVRTVDAAVTFDESTGSGSVFLVNRSLTDEVDVELTLDGCGCSHVESTQTVSDEDVSASNTLEHQDRMVPHPNVTTRIEDSVLRVTLPAVSWTAIKLV